MGVAYLSSKKQTFPNSGLEERKNNNMAMTVLALEHIYTRDYSLGDGNITHEQMTLINSGKSRADLWALAGIVAIEISVNKNNLACNSSTANWTPPGNAAGYVTKLIYLTVITYIVLI